MFDLFIFADHDVAWFDISMEYTIAMHELDPLYKLYSNHKYTFHGESSAASSPQFLQIISEFFHDEVDLSLVDEGL